MSEVAQQSGAADGSTSSEIMASPNKQKLNSMVLGDGSFESMMRERSKVSTDIITLVFHVICIMFSLCCVAIHSNLWVYCLMFSIVYLILGTPSI